MDMQLIVPLDTSKIYSVAYVFTNPEFDNPFYFCPIDGPKGFRLCNSLKEALIVKSRGEVEKQIKILTEQSGMKIEVKKVKTFIG